MGGLSTTANCCVYPCGALAQTPLITKSSSGRPVALLYLARHPFPLGAEVLMFSPKLGRPPVKLVPPPHGTVPDGQVTSPPVSSTLSGRSGIGPVLTR